MNEYLRCDWKISIGYCVWNWNIWNYISWIFFHGFGRKLDISV